jgi:uncharacterized protein YkwD
MRPGADRSDVILSRRILLLTVATAWSSRHAGPDSLPVADDRATEIEWHIRFLTNQQRLWQKVPPLEASPALADVARAHSRDMLARGFFDHISPEGRSPRDRVVGHGLTFALVAENIYSLLDGPTDATDVASRMVTGWMKNAGHRRNILEARLTQIGVGVAVSERQVVATQLFGG